jgi:hypothetical protein
LEAEQKKMLNNDNNNNNNNKKGELADQEPQDESQDAQDPQDTPQESQDEDASPESRSYSNQPPQDDSGDSNQDKEEERVNPRDFHKDYYPKDGLYKMVGGYFANHHPPTENNFDVDHTELEEKSNIGFKNPKVNVYSFGSYDNDPDFEMSSDKTSSRPQSKSDDLNQLIQYEEDQQDQQDRQNEDDSRARSDPESNQIRQKDSTDVTMAFNDEWSQNPDDEISKQVIGYFQDDRDDHHHTTRRPNIETEDEDINHNQNHNHPRHPSSHTPMSYQGNDEPDEDVNQAPPSPLSPSPLNRMSYQGNLTPKSPPSKNPHMPNNYHPFSGFYYKNKFNNS